MKKFLIIGLIVALALIVVGGAGVVVAQVRGADNATVVTVVRNQNRNTVERQFYVGPGGMMGGQVYGYGPGGMMGENPYGYGPGEMMHGYGPGVMAKRGARIMRGAGILHDYMISAFAKAVGLTVEEVDTRLANGETPREIAAAQGTSDADFPALVSQVRQSALDQAVTDGVITQAQADLMLEHMENYSGPGFGPGFGLDGCPMWDGDKVEP